MKNIRHTQIYGYPTKQQVSPLLKSVKVLKTKADCLRTSKEMGQLNAICDTGLKTGPKKRKSVRQLTKFE